ncbi:MAG: NAD(+)/NADH kinase [Clostridiales Family XIII bacterium]|jgi:NAD+ kinase|nr:NAD(+)/NADH kinase [Clostridiales Family XIII bacterium]
MPTAASINITDNGHEISKKIYRELKQKLENNGFTVNAQFNREADLTICIGGDGALLRMLEENNFPTKPPVVGINTGHLGFFQELDVKDVDEFIFKYKSDQFVQQIYRTVYADISTEKETIRLKALNEIVFRGAESHMARLNIFIGESFIEKFVGDGISISTPAGSTAYNYALGGPIVDPRLDLLLVTPIAPLNTTAYRSFTSSIVLPPDLAFAAFPEYPLSRKLLITADGKQLNMEGIRKIRAGFNDEPITLLRFKDYDFWRTVKGKLL